MARHFSEKTELGFIRELFVVAIGDIGGMLLMLLIGAMVFWLADRLDPNFVSSVAQGKSDFLPYLFGAIAILTFAAVRWLRKDEERRDRQNHADANREAELGCNRKKEPVQK